jgi:hypothetical protein
VGTLNICGFETGDAAEGVLSGTSSIQGAVKRSGSYALQCDPATTATGDYQLGSPSTTSGNTSVFSAATAFYRFYFRYGTKPGSNDEPIFQARRTSSTVKLELRINSAGNLAAYDTTPTLLATGATVLAQDTWYRIEVQVGTGTGGSYAVRIDGALEMSGTGNLTTVANVEARFGKSTNRNGQTVNFYYDDIRITDDGFPGAGAVLAMVPTADGAYTTWTIGAGAGSKYEQVDDVPHDSSTTYLLSTLVSGEAYTAAYGTASSYGISGRVSSVKSWVVITRNGASNGGIIIRLRSGTTDEDLSNQASSTSAFTAVARLFDADPATNAPWEASALDSLESGLIENSATNSTRVTQILVMVDFDSARAVAAEYVNLCGFESGVLVAETELTGGTGTVTVQSSIKRSGDYALRCEGAAANGAYARISGFNGAGTLTSFDLVNTYVRFYFYYATKPAANSEEIFMVSNSSGAQTKMTLRINSAGNLAAYDTSATIMATGATVLAQDTWYRIDVKLGTGASAAWEVRIDGASEISGTGNMGTARAARIHLGKHTNRNSQTIDFYYDDVAVAGNAYPGAGRVLRLDADADGAYTTWTIGAGAGADWEQLDEVPSDDDTTYLLSTNVVGQASTAGVEDAAAAGVTGEVNAIRPLIYAKRDGVSNSDIFIRAVIGTTVWDGSNNGIGSIYEQLGLIFNANPATGERFTVADVSGVEVGAVENSASNKTRLTVACLMVDFTPAPSAGSMQVIFCG